MTRYLPFTFNILNSIGYNATKQKIGSFLYESSLFIISYFIWILLNLIIIRVVGYRIILLQDIYKFNLQIIKYCTFASLLFFLITIVFMNIFNCFINFIEKNNIGLCRTKMNFSIKYYALRFLNIYLYKYLILAIITSIVSSGLFFTNHMINTLVEIYKNANVLKYDLSARMTGEVFMNIYDYVKDYAIVRAESNNFFIHKYDNEQTAASYRGSVVWIYGDGEKFLNEPEVGSYPNFNEIVTFEDFIKEYPYYLTLGEGFKDHYEFNKNAPFEFRIWITKSISQKLHATEGSFIESYVRGGFQNTATYPVSGITNIFSNNGDTIYIFPNSAKSAVFTSAIKNKKYKDNYFDVIINLKQLDYKHEVAEKLKSFEQHGKVYKIITDNKEIRDSIGGLNTKINNSILFGNFTVSILLLFSVFFCKRQDDLLNQSANIKNYYNIGLSSKNIFYSLDVLNVLTLIAGVIFGFILFILLNSHLEHIIYDLMQVIK